MAVRNEDEARANPARDNLRPAVLAHVTNATDQDLADLLSLIRAEQNARLWSKRVLDPSWRERMNEAF